MKYIDLLQNKVILERLVIGLEEPVLIKGLGAISARVDSGNGGFNVIHGTNFHQQGNVLMFDTFDEQGNIKKISAPIIDTISVNIGGGNIDERPVVQLNIKFGGEEYKKIPFSVTDRSSNTNPILISKSFIQDELNALIDVGSKNISNDGIEVVYGEGFMDNFKSGWKNMGNWIDNAYEKVSKANQQGGIGGLIDGAAKGAAGVIGAAGGAIGDLFGKIKEISGAAKIIKNPQVLVNQDEKIIREKFPNSIIARNLQQKNFQYDLSNTFWQNFNQVDFKKLRIMPFVAFNGRKGRVKGGEPIKGLEARLQVWKDALAASEKQLKAQGGESKTTQEQQESLLEAVMGGDVPVTPNAVISQPESTNNSAQQAEQPTESEQTSNNEQQPEDSDKIVISEEQSKHIKEMTTDFENLKYFILYFIPTTNTKELKDSEKTVVNAGALESELTLGISQGKFDSLLLKLFNIGDISKSSVTPVVKDLCKTLKSMKNINGVFVLCTEKTGQRKVDFFENIESQVVINKKQDTENQAHSQQQAIKQQQIEGIKTLTNQFNNLRKQMSRYRQAITSNDKVTQLLPQQYEKIAIELRDGWENNNHYFQTDQGKQKLNELLNSGQLQTAIIKSYLSENGNDDILQEIPEDKKFRDFNDFVETIVKYNSVQPLLQPEQKAEQVQPVQPEQTAEQEESPWYEQQQDEWIKNKMRLFKSKGII